jgi:hypothetical protein
MSTDSQTLDRHALGIIASAIEEAPITYRANLASTCDRQRIRAADALAGWIGARFRVHVQYHDAQLALPID